MLNADPRYSGLYQLTNGFYESLGYPNHYYHMLKYSHEMLIKMKKFYKENILYILIQFNKYRASTNFINTLLDLRWVQR